jgi:hypothetical protein
LTELANDKAGVAAASRDPHHGKPPAEARFDGFARRSQSTGAMTETPPSLAASVILRVAEARVEDIGHAIARLAPVDLLRMGARAGDVLKITGGTIGVARAEFPAKDTKA